LSSTHRLAEPPRVLSEQPLMPISRPSESSLRVPHLQSIEPSVGSVPWVVRSQADPACASIKKTLTCFSWGNSYWELNSFHGARHVAILEVEASVRPHHPRD